MEINSRKKERAREEENVASHHRNARERRDFEPEDVEWHKIVRIHQFVNFGGALFELFGSYWSMNRVALQNQIIYHVIT